MDKFLIRVIDALMWFSIGMTLMARFYCAKYNITSGADYIGWDTALIVIGGVIGMRLVVMIDPTFNTDK
jgi:hypothetical protein